MDIELFMGIAQLGLGLAGFSGVVVSFGGSSRMDEVVMFRLGVLLAPAFGAVFQSLLPPILAGAGLSDQTVWRISAATLAIGSIIFLSWLIDQGRRWRPRYPIFFHPVLYLGVRIGYIINVVLQVAMAAGLWGSAAEGIYTAGLSWLLLHGSLQFARLLFVRPRLDLTPEV